MIKRIGFACKFMHDDQTQKKKLLEEIQRPLNTRSTTVQWLNRQTRDVAEERLWDIMVHNIASYKRLIEYVGSLPKELRMVRLGSDVLPVYIQPIWCYWRLSWYVTTVRNTACRETARAPCSKIDVAQLTITCERQLTKLFKGIEEFEYPPCSEADGIRAHPPDSRQLTHGRQGPVVRQFQALSQEARNAIT